MLSRLVIAFLPRSKYLLISWLQSPSAVILEPPKIKSLTGPTVSPSICQEVMWPDAMILVFWMLSFKPSFSLFFTLIKRFFSSSSLLLLARQSKRIRFSSKGLSHLPWILLVFLVLRQDSVTSNLGDQSFSFSLPIKDGTILATFQAWSMIATLKKKKKINYTILV